MAGVLRGDIRWADLSSGVGAELASAPLPGRERARRRPVVVISHDIFNERSGTVIAVPLISQPQSAGFPLTLEIEDAGLPKRSWLKISQIRTLSVERLGRKLGRLSPEKLDQLIEGLNEIVA